MKAGEQKRVAETERQPSRMKGRATIIVLLVMSVVSLSGLRGQTSVEVLENVEPIFRAGVDLYSAGQYPEAIGTFDRILRGFPVNQRTTAAYVMKAKAELASGDALEAARTIRTFLSEFPSSSYRADAYYTLGLTFASANRFESAASAFLDSWKSLGSPPSSKLLEKQIVEALDRVTDSTLNVLKVRNLIDQTDSGKAKAYLWLRLAEKYAADVHISQAEAALDSLDRQYPGAPFEARIAAVRAKVQQRGDVKIGVLLPLMKRDPQSAAKEVGESILRGIQFAVNEHNAIPGIRVKVTLDIRDTERDPLVASRATGELTSDPSVVAIIGPVFSNTASAAVGLANARGIPLVTPTANSNGIAGSGQYIFQANPDYESRGRVMARFAVEKKGFHRLAVLAPIDTYAKYMAEAFADEALRLGAEVIPTEWYKRGETDFSMQLKNIRRTGMLEGANPRISFGGTMTRQEIAALVHLGVPMAKIDSLLEKSAVVDANRLLGPNARQMLDSLGVKTLLNDPRVDSLEYPVEGIDAFYVPVSMPEEIGAVSSQIVYFNFHAAILGSGEWNNFTELVANKRYCKDVVFDADSYVESEDPQYAAFVEQFFAGQKERPTKDALYGYDTAKLILSRIQAGASNRENLRLSLARTTDFRGFHSRIGFSSGRVNTWMRILRFDGDRIVPVEEMSLN